MLKTLLLYRIHRARNGSSDVAEGLPQILQVSWVRRNPRYRLRVSGVVLHSMPRPELNHTRVLRFSRFRIIRFCSPKSSIHRQLTLSWHSIQNPCSEHSGCYGDVHLSSGGSTSKDAPYTLCAGRHQGETISSLVRWFLQQQDSYQSRAKRNSLMT